MQRSRRYRGVEVTREASHRPHRRKRLDGPWHILAIRLDPGHPVAACTPHRNPRKHNSPGTFPSELPAPISHRNSWCPLPAHGLAPTGTATRAQDESPKHDDRPTEPAENRAGTYTSITGRRLRADATAGPNPTSKKKKKKTETRAQKLSARKWRREGSGQGSQGPCGRARASAAHRG